MILELNDLQSSHVRTASYNTDSKEMTVGFHDGSVYRYEDVSHLNWQNLGYSKSPGSFLRRQIIPRHKGSNITPAA